MSSEQCCCTPIMVDTADLIRRSADRVRESRMTRRSEPCGVPFWNCRTTPSDACARSDRPCDILSHSDITSGHAAQVNGQAPHRSACTPEVRVVPQPFVSCGLLCSVTSSFHGSADKAKDVGAKLKHQRVQVKHQRCHLFHDRRLRCCSRCFRTKSSHFEMMCKPVLSFCKIPVSAIPVWEINFRA